MRKIKWGVLGTAGIAESCTIPGMLKAENCELYAIAGRSVEKAEGFKIKFGFKKVYGDYEELISDNDVEAIYIPLPNDMHYEWTIKALESGKHVLCEKPIAPTEELVKKMYETANANNVYLMEAFAYLHSPFIKEIKSQIDNGVIGDITYIETAFITSDYDKSNIRMRKENFGGSLYDLGVYSTSFIQFMLDEEPVDISAVSSFSSEGIDTYTSVIMGYENGKKAAFSCGMVLETNADRRIDRFKIQGTKGTMTGEIFEFNLSGEMSYSISMFDGDKKTETIIVPHNYQLEVEQLGRCIAGEQEPFVSAEFSIVNARVIDRILEKIGY